ncbi:MAG: archaetidylserine decarboxylase [Nanoarchaeota archaeon]|nr:phosphatidylserine decarboxylase [Nanoarchaeota archaeon]MBU4300277.1 phosphatidylserine decarboxylase [Nanoarchaeota archaeon]MBU4452510.1 phosphatidylserine decarboxylase [Nanoarchaeota archaeon]MCG2723214.1 archaetidylserine decarboxylase [archaeon]
MNLFSKIIVFAFKVFPKEFISRALGKLAKKKLPKIILIPWISSYCVLFGVNMSESKKDAYDFQTFDEFFTRELKSGIRKIDVSKNSVISPVDGKMMEFGAIEKNMLIQAKGKIYMLESLLEDGALASKFENGSFLTIYLAPKNYHRIHAPISGKIAGYQYIPGSLFCVNKISSETIENLFSKNERLITYLECRKNTIAIVKVGACVVGKICATYENAAFDTSCNMALKKTYSKKIPIEKGEEIGRFEIGSTVVLLFESGVITFGDLVRGAEIKMGQKIGTLA